MSERNYPTKVVIDENAETDPVGLTVWLMNGNRVIQGEPFDRGATPEEIATRFMDFGAILKFDLGDEIEAEKFISAAFLVPGLDPNYFDSF